MLLLIGGAILVLVTAVAFAWQEKRGAAEDLVIYSVEDSVAYVMERMSPDATHLKTSDVRRILEWEMRYLQDRAVNNTGDGTVAGGLVSARYSQDVLAARGYVYTGEEVGEVLDLRAEYLDSIGAIGEPLSAEEIAQLPHGTLES